MVGLSDVIVDIVETGSTLKENGLAVLEEICPLSARMIVNQVSMQMLVAMREDPLEKLQAADVAVRDQLEALHDGDEAAALAGMLNGGPPLQPGERTQQMLCDQVAANRRRLKQIMDLDKALSQRLGRNSSAPQSGELRG